MTDRVVGVLNDTQIQGLISRGNIGHAGTNPMWWEKLIQPASIDLTLGGSIMRIRSSFLPGADRTVKSHMDTFVQYEREFGNGYIIEPGVTYLVQLSERLSLPKNVEAAFNPKSTTGRLDIFVRIIGDKAQEFDKLPLGYEGPLYAEITSATFPIKLRAGDSLVQMRLRQRGRLVGGNDYNTIETDNQSLQVRRPELADNHKVVDHGLPSFDDKDNLILSANVIGLHGVPVAYKARSHTPVIDLRQLDHYRSGEFWEPIFNPFRDYIILDPNACYILASYDKVLIPNQYAAEMTSYESGYGEFRAHYAGFFDPGFGNKNGKPAAQAVLELRTHSVPFALRQFQPVTKLRFEHMLNEPERPYGDKANYQHQGLALAKQFQSSRIST